MESEDGMLRAFLQVLIPWSLVVASLVWLVWVAVGSASVMGGGGIAGAIAVKAVLKDVVWDSERAQAVLIFGDEGEYVSPVFFHAHPSDVDAWRAMVGSHVLIQVAMGE